MFKGKRLMVCIALAIVRVLKICANQFFAAVSIFFCVTALYAQPAAMDSGQAKLSGKPKQVTYIRYSGHSARPIALGQIKTAKTACTTLLNTPVQIAPDYESLVGTFESETYKSADAVKNISRTWEMRLENKGCTLGVEQQKLQTIATYDGAKTRIATYFLEKKIVNVRIVAGRDYLLMGSQQSVQIASKLHPRWVEKREIAGVTCNLWELERRPGNAQYGDFIHQQCVSGEKQWPPQPDSVALYYASGPEKRLMSEFTAREVNFNAMVGVDIFSAPVGNFKEGLTLDQTRLFTDSERDEGQDEELENKRKK